MVIETLETNILKHCPPIKSATSFRGQDNPRNNRKGEFSDIYPYLILCGLIPRYVLWNNEAKSPKVSHRLNPFIPK